MDIWLIWVLVALLFFIVEIFTAGFAVICLSVGCLGGAVADVCGLSLEMQLLLFAAVSIAAVFTVRPLLKRTFFRKGEKVRTNADAIIGREGVVCNDIAEQGEGRVMVDGIDWKARSIDGMALSKGERVEVVEIDSVVLTVRKMSNSK